MNVKSPSYMNINDVVYVAIVLDDKSRAECRLMDPYHHGCEYGHHCTLAFGRAVTERHLADLGKKVEMRCCCIVGDMNCAAIGLADIHGCCNAHPHVTLSCRDGVKPVYSNALFEQPCTTKKEVNGVLHGTVMAFLKDGTWAA